ncbi:cytochrome P450 26A1 [Xenopus laevis]|uniref:Cytochrome P450 26A1 n=1 Tax=Xenopus laevis TaxID=8355 RepID=Q6GNJ2_XENLA|nr:cytochrome P450 26A1 [Xenopus laevis]AAH73518.1 LOC398094 protein [Xenopus laevis]ACF33502.1 cytochrome P450 family 26 subfamily A polypeptide 1 [Xenopus laevis]
MDLYTLLTSALCTLALPLLLLLTAAKLWEVYCLRRKDAACANPLPPGTMGLPFFGETLQMVLQRRRFLQVKRSQYGRIYKTHLFGSPTVRVTGAENVRQILLGEHKLVSVHWPASVRTILGAGCLSNLHDNEHKYTKKVIAQAFSREALANYVPQMEEEVRCSVNLWLQSGPCVLVYPAIKRMMFRIAMRLLLGCDPQRMDREQEETLLEAFEEMSRNLFSLPIDVPFSGLYRGLRARNLIHAQIEENIKEKLQREPDEHCKDALQLLIDYSRRNGEPINLQALKESATELLFGGHGTTASAATSLTSFLALHKDVLEKVRKELETQGLLSTKPEEKKELSIEVLQQLKYTSCVIKETLRLSPPVAGGFRVALKTFVLNGYQIPKGWNVIYSIADTHGEADLFPDTDKFNPDRFLTPLPRDSSRFGFIPFGGGVRCCIGKEFAKILLKVFVVELCRNCDWELLNGSPAMTTSPIICPVDNLPAKFKPFSSSI